MASIGEVPVLRILRELRKSRAGGEQEGRLREVGKSKEGVSMRESCGKAVAHCGARSLK